MECSPNPLPDTLRAEECRNSTECQDCNECRISKPFGQKCADQFPEDHVIKTCQPIGEEGIEREREREGEREKERERERERKRERERVRDVTFYNAKYCYAYWYAKVKKFPLLFLVVREHLCIRWSFL